jgi:hypothetical protein
MAKVFVSENLPIGFRTSDVLVDGVGVTGAKEPALREAGTVEFHIPVGAGQGRTPFRLRDGETYVVLYVSYNSREWVELRALHGMEKVFARNGRTGMKFAALLRVIAENWAVDYDVPGHHSHGTVACRLRGTRSEAVRADGERAAEGVPLA